MNSICRQQWHRAGETGLRKLARLHLPAPNFTCVLYKGY